MARPGEVSRGTQLDGEENRGGEAFISISTPAQMLRPGQESITRWEYKPPVLYSRWWKEEKKKNIALKSNSFL